MSDEEKATIDEGKTEVELESQTVNSPNPVPKIVFLGICFCVLFISYTLTQNFASTLFPHIAFYSLAIVYIVMGLTSLIIPQIQELIGLRLSFVIASVSYVLFVFSFTMDSDWFVLLCSVLLGFGGSLLWVTQGVYMALLSSIGNVGKANGLFWLIFSSNLAIGTAVLTLLTLAFELDLKVVLPRSLTVVGIVGVIMLCFIKEPENLVKEKEEKTKITKSEALKAMGRKFQKTLEVSKERNMLLLLPIIALIGTLGSFTFGLMPNLLDPSHVSIMFLCLGVPRMIAGYYSGVLYDKLGWKFVNIASMVIYVIGCLLISLGVYFEKIWLLDMAAGCFGILDSSLNILLNSTIIMLWKEESPNPFALHRFANSVVVGLALLASPHIEWWQMTIFNFVLGVAMVVCFFVIYSKNSKEGNYKLVEEVEMKLDNWS